MRKIVILLSLCIASSFATRFLFGVEVKCSLDKVFQFTVSHLEDDKTGCSVTCVFDDDDVIAAPRTLTARKSLFFYQDGADSGDASDSYEPFALFEHNCTSNGEMLKYRHTLHKSPTSHGLEYFEYSVDLLDKSGTGYEK